MKKGSIPPLKKKRNRFSRYWKLAKYLAILLLCYLSWSSYKLYSVGHRDNGESADCAIVFGAAAWHKKPSPVFQARLDHAIRLFREGRVDCLVLTGGKGRGAPFAEAEVGRDYCVTQGVPKDKIFLETISRTTHENIAEAIKVMDRHALSTALLVSDPWHLRRASLMADSQGVQHQCSATQTSKYQSLGSQTKFFLRELFFIQVYHVFGI